MKPTKLSLHNIGIVENEIITIDKPLIIFYGEIRAGKSTILKSIIWVCGGEFPTDILRHGTKEGHIELQFANGHIRREFYLSKDGKTIKARAIEFIRDGRPVQQPAAAIKELLNPFTLDQDFLVRKNETDRNKYFIELFGVDTSAEDAELVKLESQASALRSELKGYGEIDLTEYKTVDSVSLAQQRAKIIEDANVLRLEFEKELASINEAYENRCGEFNKIVNTKYSRDSERKLKQGQIVAEQTEISRLKSLISQAENRLNAHTEWLELNPELELPAEPKVPDTTALKQKILALHTPDASAIDKQLADAAASNVRAEQYQKNLAREKERLAKATALTQKEADIKTKRQAKLDKLTGINETCKVEGLKFTADGQFSFEGTSAAMLSTSQIMRLSKLLSDLYPPGLGITLIDRGESLGKSIFELIDRAKADEKAILATVVGERPAIVPEQVGVFVVDNGKIEK